jgi:hypothetical protein
MLMAMVLFAISRSRCGRDAGRDRVEHLALFSPACSSWWAFWRKRGSSNGSPTNIFMRVGDNPYVIVLTVLWVSGIVSGFLDNIPFTITMIPIVKLMLESNAHPQQHPVVGPVAGCLFRG